MLVLRPLVGHDLRAATPQLGGQFRCSAGTGVVPVDLHRSPGGGGSFRKSKGLANPTTLWRD